MNTFLNAWKLLTQSLKMIFTRAGLWKILFVNVVIVLAGMILWGLLMTGLHRGIVSMLAVPEYSDTPVVTFSALAVWYSGTMILLNFAATAFSGELIRCWNGLQISVRRGWSNAWQKRAAILWWTLLIVAVGILLRCWNLPDIFWNLAGLFVIPVLAREGVGANPFVLLYRSLRLLKCVWSETILVTLGALLLEVCFLCLLFSLAELVHGSGATGLLLLLLTLVLVYSLHNILLCGLYLYASDGVVPQLDCDLQDL